MRFHPELVEGSLSKGACRRKLVEGRLSKGCYPFNEMQLATLPSPSIFGAIFSSLPGSKPINKKDFYFANS